ncbi:MAG: MerR family transcriptional regulator [Acidimicrobiales bacterium]
MSPELAGEAGEKGPVSVGHGNGEYLMPSEVARILGVSSRTIDRWADGGRLSCFVTLGGHRRFDAEEVARVAAAMGIDVVEDGKSRPGPFDSFRVTAI